MSERRVRRVLATLLITMLAFPGELFAHVRLESSSPAANATLTTAPTRLVLRFSAHIEQRYTQLALTGPDGRLVPLGAVTFAADSDREFHADLPPLAAAGTYTVRWRTAGADGHPLDGTFSFSLDIAADTAGTRVPSGETARTAPPQHQHEHPDQASGGDPMASLPNALARAFHFAALTLLLGTIGFRTLLLPRVPLADDVAVDLRRRVWRTAAFATLALVAAALLRMWLQSVAMHGSDRAWHMPLLSLMLTSTVWGRAWVVQATLLGVFAAALVAARPDRDRIALALAVPAALGLAAIPAVSGHAAGAEGAALLAVLNDTVHVGAAGAWLGTLAVIALVGLPALSRHPDARPAAALITRFSPLALTAAALLVGTGILNSLLHFQALAQLFSTAYGRTLLLKIGTVAALLAAGAFNWQRQQPRLLAPGALASLRRSIAVEILIALTIIVITGYLTGMARPA